MYFTEEQLAAMIVMGQLMAEGDFRLAEGEKKAISNELMRHETVDSIRSGNFIGKRILVAANNMDRTRACNIVHEMTPSQMKYVLGFMVEIMKADGDIDSGEELIIESLAVVGLFDKIRPCSYEEALSFYRANH